MNFEQLHYIKAIFEEESIIHAAQKMNITQSALSQSIATFEKEVGYPLFHRSKKGTLPTEMGKHLMPYILQMIEAEAQLKNEVKAMQSDVSGTIKIATIPTLFHKIIPKALSRFKEDYPHISVEVIESERDDILHMVKNEKVDIGLGGMRADENLSQEVHIHPLNIETDFRLIAPKKSKLALKQKVTLEEVQPYPFVLFDRNIYHSNFEAYEAKNGPLKIVFRTSNPSVVIRTVSEGLGVSVVSNLMIEDNPFILQGEIAAIPIGAPFDFKMSFAAFTAKHNDASRHATVQRFISYLMHHV